VGNVGLTTLEMKSQISLWAFMNSPMLMSFDLRKLLDPAMGNIRAMLTSPGVLALNQDALGYAGRKLPRRQSVDNNAQMSDTAMRVEACNDSPDQAFVFNSSSGTLVQTSSGLAVTVTQCATKRSTIGVPVVLAPLEQGGGGCNGLNQRWMAHSNGTITSQTPQSPCLDVYGHINPVQTHFCVPNPSGAAGPPESEAWKITPISGTTTVTVRYGLPTFQKCLQGPPLTPPSSAGEVWEKQLFNGDVGLLLLNRGDTAVTNVSVDVGVIPGIKPGATVRVTNAWTGREEGSTTTSLWRMVGPHDVILLRLSQ
jgi:hypothetical protein